MKTVVQVFFFLVVIYTFTNCLQAEPSYRDLYPDSWVATDALGRTMPDYSEAGPVKNDQRRIVGIFYITWHVADYASPSKLLPVDIDKIFAADPSARLDLKNPLWTSNLSHSGEPEMGYFLSQDVYVIRKDISMLSDAGVDVLVMDVTNAVLYWDEWDVLFTTMQQMKAEGNKVPQFCFWCYNRFSITVAQELYEKIYKPEKYKDLWFYWDDKPLLLYNATPYTDCSRIKVTHPNPHYDADAKTNQNNPHYGDPYYTEEFYTDYTHEVKDFFTLRNMWWGYYEWEGQRYIGTEDKWCFGYDLVDEKVKVMKPEELVSKHDGQPEQAAVTPAQHPMTLSGRCWTRDNGEPPLNEFDLPVPTFVPWLGKTVEHPEGYGIYFQQRWDEAIQANPQFLYINDWNEWTADRFESADGKPTPFMRRDSPYYFWDQYNHEFSRSIQPMKDGYTDNYYMQMAQNIRRYKGVRPIPELIGFWEVSIDGDFTDWSSRDFTEYRDTVGDTLHRGHPGYGKLHYTNNSGRNDIITCKVSIGQDQIFFYAETKDNLTPYTDIHWMLLLIDADKDTNTGWFGYDYLINYKVKDDKITTLMKYDTSNSANPWVEQTELNYRYSGKQLEISIPRKELDLVADTFTFDFHWCDNPVELKDPISLCTDGDSAPNRRFNYRAIWKKS